MKNVMGSLMRVPFMLVFHQCKRISAIKRIFFYYRHVCIFVFFHVLVCTFLLGCMSSALRVGVKKLNSVFNLLEF